MVTYCVIYKCSNKHKNDCLSALRKDADTKTLEVSKERRRVWLTRINRPSYNLSKAQFAIVYSTIFVFVASVLLMVDTTMSNLNSIKLTVPLVNR